jgi:hypothetical protein
MIGCKGCAWRCADYVRNAQGEQRSGYVLLELHYKQAHGALPRHKGPFWDGNPIYSARLDERCGNCDGRKGGCEGCEPAGHVERWNFNTLERIDAPA